MSTLQERAKIRASEQRKLEHACDVVGELIVKHMPNSIGEHELNELHMMKLRLLALIKSQHVRDRCVAEARVEAAVGDY